jgi:hypothetical protein
VVDRAPRDGHAEHLFEADGLGAELNLVVVPPLAPTALVLHGIWNLSSVRSAVTEFDKVGYPSNPKPVADKSEPACNASAAPGSSGDVVHAAMVERAAGGVHVFNPDAVNPQESAAPFTKEQVIQSREWRIIITFGGLPGVNHDAASTIRCKVTPSGIASTFT